jgi:hypothetical protein
VKRQNSLPTHDSDFFHIVKVKDGRKWQWLVQKWTELLDLLVAVTYRHLVITPLDARKLPMPLALTTKHPHVTRLSHSMNATAMKLCLCLWIRGSARGRLTRSNGRFTTRFDIRIVSVYLAHFPSQEAFNVASSPVAMLSYLRPEGRVSLELICNHYGIGTEVDSLNTWAQCL